MRIDPMKTPVEIRLDQADKRAAERTAINLETIGKLADSEGWRKCANMIRDAIRQFGPKEKPKQVDATTQ